MNKDQPANEVIWPEKNNFMHGLKSALLVQPSKTTNRIFFSFIFSFIFLNMKPLSEVAPGVLAIQIQIKAV